MNKKIISLSIIIIGVVCATTYFLKEDKIELKEITQQSIQKLQSTEHNMRVVKRPEIKPLTQEEIEEDKKDREKMQIIMKYGKQYLGRYTLEELDIIEKDKTEINMDNLKDITYLYDDEDGNKVFKIYKEINEKDVSFKKEKSIYFRPELEDLLSYKPIHINIKELLYLSKFKNVSFQFPLSNSGNNFNLKQCVKKDSNGLIIIKCNGQSIIIEEKNNSAIMNYSMTSDEIIEYMNRTSSEFKLNLFNGYIFEIENNTGYVTHLKPKGSVNYD